MQLQKALGMRYRIHRNQKRNDVADRCGNRRSRDFQTREEKQAVDQKRVEHKIDKVGGDVGHHRNPRVAHAALGRGDRQADAVKEVAEHDNPEIRHRQT